MGALPMSLGQMPGASPQGAPPPGAPAPVPGPPPPGAGAPPQSPMSGMYLLLSFLAGSGLEKTVNSIGKIAKLGAPAMAAMSAKKAGIQGDAAKSPNQTIAPQLAQMLASKAAQQPSGSDDLVALLAKALQSQVGPGGGGSPIGNIG